MPNHNRQTQDGHKVIRGNFPGSDHPADLCPSCVRGVRYRSEERYHKAPWQLTLYHEGKKTRTFHATLEDAKKEKGKADRLRAKEGSRAFSYDRAAQAEYEEAKRIVGLATPLVPFLRQAVVRKEQERKTVAEASAHFLEAKSKLGLAYKTEEDMTGRLKIFGQVFRGRSLETITRNELVDWLNQMPHLPRTVWNYYRTVGALLNYAERRDWIDKNPMRKIDPNADLPKCRKSPVQILTVEQGKATMRYVEQKLPHLLGWACVQYFAGIRDAEAERMRGEWIDPARKLIVIPGWYMEGDKAQGVTKTRDDWVMDTIPDAFWLWVARYPSAFAAGPLAAPTLAVWLTMRNELIAAEVFPKWPANGFRHSFATYHLSAYRNQSATSLLLRHRNASQLWNSYLSKLVPPSVALTYLSLPPKTAQ